MQHQRWREVARRGGWPAPPGPLQEIYDAVAARVVQPHEGNVRCVDVPGVGGGRDIPFNRYDDLVLHDKGGTTVIRTRDATPIEIYLRLQAVTWQVLNEANDSFNRNSLVLYAYQKQPDGTMGKGSYAFTDVEATRIGNNLGWMLVNCAVTRRNEARPEM